MLNETGAVNQCVQQLKLWIFQIFSFRDLFTQQGHALIIYCSPHSGTKIMCVDKVTVEQKGDHMVVLLSEYMQQGEHYTIKVKH